VLSKLDGSCTANLASSWSCSPRQISLRTHAAESGHELRVPSATSIAVSRWEIKRVKPAHAEPLAKMLAFWSDAWWKS
jgi:hypothetical protein